MLTYGKRKAKGSIYQGGINVPLVVTGKNVKRTAEIEKALINSTDLFATISKLAGANVDTIHDSKSFAPLLFKKNLSHKKYLYSELKNKRKSGYTIRNDQFKYINYDNGNEELFDLKTDPFETENLANSTSYSNIKQDLINKVSSLRGDSMDINKNSYKSKNHKKLNFPIKKYLKF